MKAAMRRRGAASTLWSVLDHRNVKRNTMWEERHTLHAPMMDQTDLVGLAERHQIAEADEGEYHTKESEGGGLRFEVANMGL
jgi:hypothetical protein